MATHLQKQLCKLKHGKTTNFLDFVGNGSLCNADGDYDTIEIGGDFPPDIIVGIPGWGGLGEDDELPCGGEKEPPSGEPGNGSGGGTGGSGGDEQPETETKSNAKKIFWIGIIAVIIVFLFKD